MSDTTPTLTPIPVPARPAKSALFQPTTFVTSRLADFCSEKELTKQTGHSAAEWPLVVVKELMDNALDACEDVGIPPIVHVTVDDDGIEVTDNGPGIPPETVEGLLDYSVKVSSREAYVGLARGAQGNALQTILAMPYALDGQRGRVQIEAKGVRHTIHFTVDPIQQKPLITRTTELVTVTNGTTVRVQWPNSPRSKLDEVKDRFLQIAEDFTWLNPHLELHLDWFGELTTVEATDPDWKKWRPTEPSSPYWYETQHLERLIGAELRSGRERTVREFVAEFRGLKGTAKQKAVLDATGLSGAALSRLVKDGHFDKPLVGLLLTAMRANSTPVKPSALGIIGEEHLRQRFEAIGCEMETFKYRKLAYPDNLPTIVEVAFGWCPQAITSRRLVTGVNCSAAIIDPFRTLGDRGGSLETVLTRQYAQPEEAVIVVLHMALPRANYTDRGKSAVETPSHSVDRLVAAVEDLTKVWAKQRKAEIRSETAEANRHRALTRSSTPIKQKEAAWEIIPAAYLKASANGTLPALTRQIMYAARPHIQERTGRDLDDKYFTGTLLPDYIKAHPEGTRDWNVVCDARGHFHEPHTRHDVPLGTRETDEYLAEVESHTVDSPNYDIRETFYPTRGPKHRYGAILFIEKEGFKPLFDAVQLAERYDLAIMSTKGMSNTASRALVDTICANRPIPLLVVHDFDKSGFSIFGTLKENTRRYTYQNDINVIDLGMRISDIDDLQSEVATKLKDDVDSVKATLERHGATPDEIEFLLERRVELNAFTSDALVTWLEKKLEQHGVKKIIPDDATLVAAWRRASEQAAVQRLITKAVAGWQSSRATATTIDPTNLRSIVEQALKRDPTRTWDSVVMETVP